MNIQRRGRGANKKINRGKTLERGGFPQPLKTVLEALPE
jgi:hypothetical protein